jgi:hypothetical protein
MIEICAKHARVKNVKETEVWIGSREVGSKERLLLLQHVVNIRTGVVYMVKQVKTFQNGR